MEWLIEIQIQLIAAWQRSVNWTEPMRLIGSGYDYLPYFVATILLGYSRRLGVELFLLGSFSAALSPILKWSFHSPRPYWVSPEVNAYGPAESYGIPSGHVQAVATILFWTA